MQPVLAKLGEPRGYQLAFGLLTFAGYWRCAHGATKINQTID
ncbi:hypothetical protein ACLK1Y_04375 [Escherichia coli]